MQKHTHTHPFNGHFSGTIQVSWYQNSKNNLDFTEARDSEWQWHQLGLMQVCISLQSDNHASTPPLGFLPAECPSCCPTNSFKALEASSNICRKLIRNKRVWDAGMVICPSMVQMFCAYYSGCRCHLFVFCFFKTSKNLFILCQAWNKFHCCCNY